MTRFVQHDNDTVTDTQTGLIWMKKTLVKDVTHQDAEQAVADLGDGWRLPTIQELFSLADHSKHSPAIDADAFPDTESDWYWTSTSCAWNDSARWVVYFYYGYVNNYPRHYYACVRAVRAGQ
ncbi:DUF1566 domain-containing protein [Marinobacterium sp. BA1]|uniref:Lcl C-terminal domain-containing protein n=1 Tax=Marinobacterium sp. BA1 TaxID=3138931 RepID=UPI0032E79EF9